MPTIYADATDGYVYKSATGGPSWASVRDATSGTGASSTTTARPFGIRVDAATGRGGLYAVERSFFAFDISSISTEVASATINLRGYSNGTGDVICVKATAPDLTSNLVVGDFDAIDGFSAGASMAGNATDYSAEVATWSTSGYNTITLTADALSDMEDDSILKVCVVNYDYDYLNVDLGFSGGNHRNGVYYADRSGTSFDPYIEYTLAGAAVASVDGVAIGNITKIDGIAKANIASINGVDVV